MNIYSSPRIGIVASAHRPQNWMDLYKSIGENDIEFELVFVGPNKPDYSLPKNFRFIQSYVKPTQCFEIAFRNTTAELVMSIADDCEFKGAQPLDRLYEAYKAINNEKLMLSCRYSLNGVDLSSHAHHFDCSDPSTPVMPLSALMSKKFFSDLGGIDRNFIAIMWDLDIAMRAYVSGGEVVLADVFLDENRNKGAMSVLCSEFWRHDRGLLESLWTNKGKIHFHRTKPVEPFSDLNILKTSQGPRGRWRGNGPIVLEKFVDELMKKKYVRWIGRGYRAIRRPAMYPTYTKKLLHCLTR